MKEILLADDDEDQIFLLQTNLRKHGILTPIRHFDNGKQLIEYLFAHECDETRRVVLLDLSMPIMDGMEALKTIKSDDKLKRLPIIIWTTTNIEEIMEKCYDLGCNAFITKPMDPTSFWESQLALGKFMQILSIPKTQKRA